MENPVLAEKVSTVENGSSDDGESVPGGASNPPGGKKKKNKKKKRRRKKKAAKGSDGAGGGDNEGDGDTTADAAEGGSRDGGSGSGSGSGGGSAANDTAKKVPEVDNLGGLGSSNANSKSSFVPPDFIRINGVKVPRAKMQEYLEQGFGTGFDKMGGAFASHDAEQKILQRSVEYGSVEQELRHWRGRFREGKMGDKELADYNTLLTSMSERLTARTEDLSRQHMVARAQLRAASRRVGR